MTLLKCLVIPKICRVACPQSSNSLKNLQKCDKIKSILALNEKKSCIAGDLICTPVITSICNSGDILYKCKSIEVDFSSGFITYWSI